MSKTKFTELAKYYRPVSILSFSLDYFIWGLNPYGYHLTDLTLHTMVSIFVFFLIRFLTNGKQLQAWLSAVIFSAHPILVEVVPGIARRQDIIATLFIIISLLFFLKHLNCFSGKRLFLFISMLSYALALGSKEIAVILPPLIFAYLFIFSYGEPFKNRLFQTIRKSSPFFLLTFVYLFWRMHLLQGIGGRFGLSHKPVGISGAILSMFKIIATYCADLLYPVDIIMVNLIFNIFNHTSITLMIVLFSIIFLLFYRHKIFGIAASNTKETIKIFYLLLLTVVILSLIGILTSSLISPYVDKLIPMAFNEKLKLLANAMESRYALPTEFYRGDFILKLLFFILASVSSICLITFHQPYNISCFLSKSMHGGLIVFFLIWLCMPLCIYLATLTFTHFYMYNSIIPFSAFLAVIFIETLQSVVQNIRKKERSNYSDVFSFIIIVSLLISILAYSPLLKRYRDWESASNLYVMFFQKLAGTVTGLPDNATIKIYDLPQLIVSSKSVIPRAQTATFLTDYAIKAWLNLNYPKNNMEVIAINRGGIYTGISELKIEKTENNSAVIIRVFGEKTR